MWTRCNGDVSVPMRRSHPSNMQCVIVPRAQERAKRSEYSGTVGRLSSKNGRVRHRWPIELFCDLEWERRSKTEGNGANSSSSTSPFMNR